MYSKMRHSDFQTVWKKKKIFLPVILRCYIGTFIYTLQVKLLKLCRCCSNLAVFLLLWGRVLMSPAFMNSLTLIQGSRCILSVILCISIMLPQLETKVTNFTLSLLLFFSVGLDINSQLSSYTISMLL